MKKGKAFSALLAITVFIVAILFATRVIKMQIGYDVNPGWGTQLGDLMASDSRDIDLDKVTKNWKEGSFGKLVSLMQGNQNAPAIKNLV
jgi:hypothetical protein